MNWVFTLFWTLDIYLTLFYLNIFCMCVLWPFTFVSSLMAVNKFDSTVIPTENELQSGQRDIIPKTMTDFLSLFWSQETSQDKQWTFGERLLRLCWFPEFFFDAKLLSRWFNEFFGKNINLHLHQRFPLFYIFPPLRHGTKIFLSSSFCE